MQSVDRTISIVLADDHPLVRDGLRALLTTQTDMQIVGEAADGDAACEAARRLQPDLIVLDLSMPGPNGTQVAERIREVSAQTKIVILTVHEEPAYVIASIKAGAHGYVLKRSASAGLIDAVHAVMTAGTYIDPAVTHALAADFLTREQADAERDLLSPREREVLIRIAQGFSNKEIAAQLDISIKTVETYKARLAAKMGLHSRVDIVRYAMQRGWLASS